MRLEDHGSFQIRDPGAVFDDPSVSQRGRHVEDQWWQHQREAQFGQCVDLPDTRHVLASKPWSRPFPSQQEVDLYSLVPAQCLGEDVPTLLGETLREKVRAHGLDDFDVADGGIGVEGRAQYGVLRRVYMQQQPDHMSADDLVARSEEHTSELQSRFDLVCRLL